MISTDFSERKGPVTNASHEIGHSYNLGRADDDFWEAALKDGEIYTGSGADETAENITRKNRPGWGLMRAGYENHLVFTYNGTTHFVYSIEELSTIEEP